MIITARATHISHTPRKVNLVAKSIVGLPVDEALNRLQFTVKRASAPVSLVLKQAVANATHNFQLNAKDLIVDRAFATKGRTLKKGLMGGRMRYKPVEKIAAHLTIDLRSIEKKVAAPKPAAKAEATTKKSVKTTK